MHENGRFKYVYMQRQMIFLPDYIQFDTAEYTIYLHASWTMATVDRFT